VYLPDDLADAVRDSGVPVSAICQRALEQAIRRMQAIREVSLSDLDPASFSERLPTFTGRLVIALSLATERAKKAGATVVTTGDLLGGMLAEGGNLALQILTAMEVAPASLLAPSTPEPASSTGGLHFSTPAAVALELAVGEAVGFGHNYVGCEHLIVALAGEPDGTAGELLRSRGADARSTRRAVAAALAGYVHLRASAAAAPASSALMAAFHAGSTRLEQGRYLAGDLRGLAAVGGDRVGRDRGVERAALVEQIFQGGARVDREQRAVAAEADPLHRVGKLDRQVDDRVPGEQFTGALVEDRAAAEREHAGELRERRGDDRTLQGPERVLAVVDEDLRDRFAGLGLDQRVGVRERDAEQAGDQLADGGLAGPGSADEDGDRSHQRITRLSR
jgi:ATP-dependent Clp protease ATP-binding subunit ClpC